MYLHTETVFSLFTQLYCSQTWDIQSHLAFDAYYSQWYDFSQRDGHGQVIFSIYWNANLWHKVVMDCIGSTSSDCVALCWRLSLVWSHFIWNSHQFPFNLFILIIIVRCSWALCGPFFIGSPESLFFKYSFRASGLRLMPIPVHLAIPVLPLAFGLVDLLTLSDALRLVCWFIVLFQVTFALAASHHCDLVGPGAAILALQLNAFGAGLVINAAPVLAAPSAPRLFTISSYPVGEHLGSEALSCTHQLFNGVDAGALAVRDVLRGAQFSAAHWTWIWN